MIDDMPFQFNIKIPWKFVVFFSLLSLKCVLAYHDFFFFCEQNAICLKQEQPWKPIVREFSEIFVIWLKTFNAEIGLLRILLNLSLEIVISANWLMAVGCLCVCGRAQWNAFYTELIGWMVFVTLLTPTSNYVDQPQSELVWHRVYVCVCEFMWPLPSHIGLSAIRLCDRSRFHHMDMYLYKCIYKQTQCVNNLSGLEISREQ